MTRKEKLEIWRARKGAETAPQSRLQNTLNSASSSLGKGVLAARPFPSNGVERAVSRRTKENVMRKPFQVRESVPVPPLSPALSHESRKKRKTELDLCSTTVFLNLRTSHSTFHQGLSRKYQQRECN